MPAAHLQWLFPKKKIIFSITKRNKKWLQPVVCLAVGKTWGKEWNRLSPLHCMGWGGNGCTDTCRESSPACLPGYAPKSLFGIRERNRGQSELKGDKIVKRVRRENLCKVQGGLSK